MATNDLHEPNHREHRVTQRENNRGSVAFPLCNSVPSVVKRFWLVQPLEWEVN